MLVRGGCWDWRSQSAAYRKSLAIDEVERTQSKTVVMEAVREPHDGRSWISNTHVETKGQT